MTPAALAPGQDALWDLEEPEPKPTPEKRPASRRRHVLGLPKPWHPIACAPACLRCGRTEGEGLCTPRCAVICGRPTPIDPKKGMPVEVCLVTTHVTAVLITGTPTLYGARHLALVCCPHCGQVHWHAAVFGARYRVSACGLPYIVHLDRPRITNGGVR